MDQVAVPSFFLCPISLELMRDPVTLSTGMTYDRASIEKWLGLGHNTCPTTNQILDSQEMIPNHTLRRLLHNWCVENEVHDLGGIPTLKELETDMVTQLLKSIAQCREMEWLESLRKLRMLAKECEHHRKRIVDAGGVGTLAAAMGRGEMEMSVEACEDAVSLIVHLQLGDGDKRALSEPKTLSHLGFVLTSGSLEGKVNAADVIHALCMEDSRLIAAVGDLPGAIKAIANLLREDLYPRAVQSGLRCLQSVCLSRRNRVTAINCRTITTLVALLPNTNKRNKERVFALLEILANCAEGREAISNHALAIPVMVKSMLGVSYRATEHAVAALWLVLSYASNRNVINSALQAGAFTNLLMLLPSECSQLAKRRAQDSVKLLNEVWDTHRCRPVDYPRIAYHRNVLSTTEPV